MGISTTTGGEASPASIAYNGADIKMYKSDIDSVLITSKHKQKLVELIQDPNFQQLKSEDCHTVTAHKNTSEAVDGYNSSGNYTSLSAIYHPHPCRE
jgi:hypothetical protein